VDEGAEQRPEAAKSTTVSALLRQSILAKANLAPPDDGRGLQKKPQVDFPSGKGRQHAEEDAGQQGEEKRESQDGGCRGHIRDGAENVRAEQQ